MRSIIRSKSNLKERGKNVENHFHFRQSKKFLGHFQFTNFFVIWWTFTCIKFTIFFSGLLIIFNFQANLRMHYKAIRMHFGCLRSPLTDSETHITYLTFYDEKRWAAFSKTQCKFRGMVCYWLKASISASPRNWPSPDNATMHRQVCSGTIMWILLVIAILCSALLLLFNMNLL